MKQKDIFLGTETDAWFERNHEALQGKAMGMSDPIIEAVSAVAGQPEYFSEKARIRLLEVGCGEAKRLAWISEKLGLDVYGVEPSVKAVELAKGNGVRAERGTADRLPFESGFFDIVIFGFCLYLCDREDLFTIAQEADHVLDNEGWLVIHDFFSPTPIRRDYHHKQGVSSFKMDYRKLFDWHPSYTCYSHKLAPHEHDGFTDDPQEWVSTSILRKKS